MEYEANQSVALSNGLQPMAPRRFRIERVKWVTSETFTHVLKPIDGGEEFVFKPGQFNMIYMFGVGEIAISISGDPADKRHLVHTTRVVGSVTTRQQHLQVGDVLGIRGPFGNSWPVDQAKNKDVLVIAGGIGLAPLRPVMYELINNRENYGRVTLLYGSRSPDKILYMDQLKEWKSRFDLDVHVTVDSSPGDWNGNVGVVTKQIPKAMVDPENTIAFVCGPEIMMRFAAHDLLRFNIPEESIWISMERNCKCGIGLCGHCQLGSYFICKDGPVFNYNKIKSYLTLREV